MYRLTILSAICSLLLFAGCRQGNPDNGDQPTADNVEEAVADSVFVPKQDPQKIPYLFSGDLSKYYFVRMCTVTRLSRLELETLGVPVEDDHHYYIASVGLVRNNVPFDFPVDDIECMYDVWLVPTSFPDGKFNIHAQLIDSHNNRVSQLDFSKAVELKDLLRKCPNQGDFMVIEDLFSVERYFDHPSNKLDIRGYIKPVKEGVQKGKKTKKG